MRQSKNWRGAASTFASVLAAMSTSTVLAAEPASAAVFEARERDWRNGAVVYQVMVDRFAPSVRLTEKRALYPAPKVLRAWSEAPVRGVYNESLQLWGHELDFWGGDLASVQARLGYVQDLGAEVLYLNPVHLAYTNHKYDALDYRQVSPEFGTRADLRSLTDAVHHRGMKLVLDGVFNHIGRRSPLFEQASASPAGQKRDWFVFGPQYAGGYRSWSNAGNLPELNLENPAVRDDLWRRPDSVVRQYLRDGIDGWRLDVAYDIGFDYLRELTESAHREKPGSLIVGEIANYPQAWFPSVDGVLNFSVRDIVLKTAAGKIDATVAAQMLERIVTDAGTEPMLKSWLLLDNHDNPRLASVLPDAAQRRIAQVLQFTLPGSPNLYYGTELGMTGGEDPAMRAPMRWDLVATGNAELAWTRQLIALHRANRALRVGNFRLVTAGKLLAFERYTDRARDTVVVLVNPSASAVTETVMVANSSLMNGESLHDLLDASAAPIPAFAGLMDVSLPAGGFRVLAPDVRPDPRKPGAGYTPYKRVP